MSQIRLHPPVLSPVAKLILSMLLCAGVPAAAAQICDPPAKVIAAATGSQTVQLHRYYLPLIDCKNQCQIDRNKPLPDVFCPGGEKFTISGTGTIFQSGDFAPSLNRLFKLLPGDLKKSDTEAEFRPPYTSTFVTPDLTAHQSQRVIHYATKSWSTESETRTDPLTHTSGSRLVNSVVVWGSATIVMGSLQSYDPCHNVRSGPPCPKPK
ncbi:MAG TPA: hypothetical protein VFJ58_15940 [Armatimonadota bacterium]|nr:hypothetical protein [Armatimonadota bacterium]